MNRLFDELKRRNVYKVAVAYAVVGWLLIQIATQVLPFLEIPNWAIRLVIALVAIGFPVALIIAWAFELTPEGIKRTEDVDRATPELQPRKHAWILIVIVGGALSAGLFFLGRYTNRSATHVVGTQLPAKSIAVLPFENLSDDKSNAYFASGMQDMILTKLAAIGDLKVISRASTERYKSRPDDLKAVAQQLGVATILEGSVQKSGSQVLINVQLIDAATDHHLWAEAYPRTVDNIFGVEGEVAEKVAEALKAKLAPAESARVGSVPTKNPEAYDLFLKGQYLFGQLQVGASSDPVATGREAIDLYGRAVGADPNFALAYARWSYLESYLHWYNVDPVAEVVGAARNHAERALALQPNLPEAHLALGYSHYYGRREYDAALREFALAQANLPNDAGVFSAIAYVHRRQGDPERAIAEMQRAMELDPRDSILAREIGNSYTILRRYADADSFYARSLAIAPNSREAEEQRAGNTMFRGDFEKAIRDLAAIPAEMDTQGSVALIRFRLAMRLHQPDQALAAIAHSPPSLMTRWEHSVTPRALLRGEALQMKGETEAARAAFLEAAQQVKANLDKPTQVVYAQSYLGLIYAGLGGKEAALQAARAAVESLPMSRDLIDGAFYLERLARTEAQVGETQSALDHVEQLMAAPAGLVISRATLRADAFWDPLRKEPRFQRLIAEPAK